MGEIKKPIMARFTLVLSLLALSQAYDAPAKPDDMSCKFKDEATGTSYDLTELMALNPGETQDRISADAADYKYTFAICSTVAAPKECQNADGSSRVSHYWAPAWQTKKSEEGEKVTGSTTCFYLGNPDWAEHGALSLYDPEDPAAGVSLQYSGGQSCHSGKLRRAIKFNFRCVRNGIETFEKNIIDESEHCGYEVTIDSKNACPMECGFGGSHSPCGDHGVCGYDTDRKASRCFCNDGYTGNGCGDEVKSDDNDYGAILGLLIFVVIALVALAGGGLFMFRYLQKRTLSLDGESYSKLENSFGDGLVENGSQGPTRMGVSAGGPSNI